MFPNLYVPYHGLFLNLFRDLSSYTLPLYVYEGEEKPTFRLYENNNILCTRKQSKIHHKNVDNPYKYYFIC